MVNQIRNAECGMWNENLEFLFSNPHSEFRIQDGGF